MRMNGWMERRRKETKARSNECEWAKSHSQRINESTREERNKIIHENAICRETPAGLSSFPIASSTFNQKHMYPFLLLLYHHGIHVHPHPSSLTTRTVYHTRCRLMQSYVSHSSAVQKVSSSVQFTAPKLPHGALRWFERRLRDCDVKQLLSSKEQEKCFFTTQRPSYQRESNHCERRTK